ncbi:MAG: alpha/beta hydrolase fold domain-containing protein [Candidatus Nanopelagicaceae bacterium]
MLLVASVSIVPTTSAANPDDGYPQGQAAPGRTCPMNDEGNKQVSEFNGKVLICTLIDGVKKWWIEGEPLPIAPAKPAAPTKSSDTNNSSTAGNSEDNMPPGFKHTYFLPAKSIAKMKVIEDESYSAIDSKMRLDVYLPKGVAKPPLMIWVHGGGMIFGNENTIKYDEGAKLLEVLIKNKIAVASVNYRLATEVPYPVSGQDIKTAIRYLRANAAKYGFDPKKFAIGGDSAGAYLSLMAAITGNQKSLFDDSADPNLKTSASVSAVFDLFGNANVLTMTENKIKYPCQDKSDFAYGLDPKMSIWFGDVTLPENREKVDSANLYPFLAKNKSLPSFFIFHGTADCSVSKYDSIELDSKVKALKGKSILKLSPGENHGGPKIWVEVMKQVPALAKLMAAIK